MEYTGKYKAPCYPNGKPCTLRGTEVCHTDKCPHGWKEYQEKIQKERQGKAKARRENTYIVRG